MADLDFVRCIWCNKKWEWDWCQDTIVGLDYVEFTYAKIPSKLRDFELHLYVCTCGGSLGVVTLEPCGSSFLQALAE